MDFPSFSYDSCAGLAGQDQDSRARSRGQASLVQGQGLPREQGSIYDSCRFVTSYLSFLFMHTSLYVGHTGTCPGAQQASERREPESAQVHRRQFRWPRVAPSCKRQIHMFVVFSGTEVCIPDVLNHQDSAKNMFAEELLAYSDSFNASAFFSCLRSMGDVTDEAGKQTQQNSTLLTTCFFV